ncbi:hypothetical protein F5Y03DRAFT_403165 [Xylaria venustula]|nr:hypothetical protein F5Y03DRAFT_403165 [Xylaria venustula]
MSSENDVVIAVMGMTGSGKSSLISLCVDQEVKIGHDLKSCTQDVETYVFHHPALRSGRVYLVDTPGFDDTNRKDTEILRTLGAWLTSTYTSGVKLSGIIYCHRINQTRMQGSALKNIQMFRSLCGDDALRKVVLVTTLWDIENLDIAVKREKELKETTQYWGGMVAKGSQVFRHDNTRHSAFSLIENFIRDSSKVVLGIQKEIVSDRKPLDETEVGKNVKIMLEEQNASLKKDIKNLESELRMALRTKDEEIAGIMTQLRLEHKEALQQVLDNQQRLQATMQQLHKSKAAELEAQLEEERHKSRSQVQDAAGGSNVESAGASQFLKTQSRLPPANVYLRNRFRRYYTDGLSNIRFICISPDGSYMAINSHDEVQLLTIDTGTEIDERYQCSGLGDISPDGRFLALRRDGKLYKATVGLGSSQTFHLWRKVKGYLPLAISKGFKTILSVGGPDAHTVGLASLETGEWDQLEWPTEASLWSPEHLDWKFAKHDELLICCLRDCLYFFSTESRELIKKEQHPDRRNRTDRSECCLSGDTLTVGFFEYRSYWFGTKVFASFFCLSRKLPKLVSTIVFDETGTISTWGFSLSFDACYLSAVNRLTKEIYLYHVMSGNKIHSLSTEGYEASSFFPSDNRLLWVSREGYYEVVEVAEEK